MVTCAFCKHLNMLDLQSNTGHCNIKCNLVCFDNPTCDSFIDYRRRDMKVEVENNES